MKNMSSYRFGIPCIFSVAFLVCQIHTTHANIPLSSDPKDVKFYLYNNVTDLELNNEIPYGNKEALTDFGYKVGKPLIILIHGVLSNRKTPTDVLNIKNAYLEDGYDGNIIMVDYGPLTVSNFPFLLSPLSIFHLLRAHRNTNIVGRRIADFILFLIKSQVLSGPENVHLIGFSLGSHVAGTIGYHILKDTGKQIHRITGLDPSPQGRALETRLDESDAKFVDITFTSLVFDNTRAKGHVNFYINGGGPHQMNCPNFAPFTETFCSHVTAIYYYVKSIKNKTIPACKCVDTCRVFVTEPKPCESKDMTLYGDPAPENTRGKFYVELS